MAKTRKATSSIKRERRQLRASTQEKLRVSEEEFRLLVETVEEYAIYLLDPKGNVATWNLGAEKLKGYTAEEIIGKNFACFYTDEDVAARKPQRNLEAAARLGHIRDQGLRVRKDGSTFQADVVMTALRDESGKLRGFSKVTRDITDQIRARESEAAKIAAEKANKAKDDFLAALSHELRTPLTPTLAAASYLSTKYAAKKHQLWADPVRIQQVFWNLINNAVKFTPPGGKIDICTRKNAQGQFEFQISD